ncbi:hypothetical protein [Flavobacterium sp. JP2137]|uniref:hypothetical protein n=1 Tax=Flavobacterium sp. JP2137 TaxID=3414510 RepID=UPI003D30074F
MMATNRYMLQFRLILLLLLPFFSWGQDRIIDSLEVLLQDETLTDRERIIPLSQLALYYKNDASKAIAMGQQSIDLAQKQRDRQYEIYAYSQMGMIYALYGDVPKSYEYLTYIQNAIKNSKEKDALAFGYNNMGVIKLLLGDQEGLEDVYTSLSLVAKTDYKLLALNYSILSNYYLSDVDSAEKYSQLAVANALKSHDYHTLCYAYSVRGVRYLAEFEKTRKPELLDLALMALEKAAAVYNQHPGYVRNSAYINIVTNLLYVYQFKYEHQPDPNYLQAVDRYTKQILELPMESNEDYVINHYMIRIKSAMIRSDLKAAEALFLELIPVVSLYPKQFRNKYELHRQLALIYEENGNFQEAAHYFKAANTYYQQFYDDKYTKTGQQQNAKFELAKKEIEFQENQYLMLIGLGAVLIVLIFLIVFVVQFTKQKKEEVLLYAKIKEEEAKNLEIAKINAELHAQLQTEETQRLQKEVLAKNIQVSHKNEILLHLKQDLQSDIPIDTQQLNKILKNENLLDKKFEEFERIIQQTHPEFYSRLQEQAQQKLTALDLKYCVYIFMQMPSKEMADLLHVELKTIRMNKYRLKRKLRLDKAEKLEEFIQNIV